MKNGKKTENKTDERDYSHLPRARDFKLPEEISPELKELMEATREAMEALRLEEEKYGKKPVFDTSIFSPFKSEIEKEIAFALLPSIVLYELKTTPQI